jgi:FixJ family two-component response regulator
MEEGALSGPVTNVVVLCAEPDRCDEYRRLLPAARYDVRWYARGREVLDNPVLAGRPVLIVDETLSDMRGVEFVRAARDIGISEPVLMTVRKISIPDAVAAIRFGADNVLTTPLDALKLEQAIKGALNHTAPVAGVARP